MTTFVKVKHQKSDAIGLVPESALKHWQEKGFELVEDKPAADEKSTGGEKPSGGGSAPSETPTSTPTGGATAGDSADSTTDSRSKTPARGGQTS